MKKVNKLFKIFIPVLLASVALAILFASLALCLTFYEDTGNINMISPLAIFFVTFVLISLVIPVIFVFLFKDLKITRTKRDLPIIKFAAALILVALIAFEVYDIVFMVQIGFEIWRFLRLFLAALLVLHLVFGILPSKTKIPPFIRHTANASAPLFTITSVLAIYFYGGATPIPEYFKILFVMGYSFLTLFLLYDFKWKLIPTNPRSYTALSSMAFAFGATISLTSIIALIARHDLFTQDKIVISIFEIALVFALSFLGFAKTMAVKQTVSHVVKISEEHEAKRNSNEQK